MNCCTCDWFPCLGPKLMPSLWALWISSLFHKPVRVCCQDSKEKCVLITTNVSQVYYLLLIPTGSVHYLFQPDYVSCLTCHQLVLPDYLDFFYLRLGVSFSRPRRFIVDRSWWEDLTPSDGFVVTVIERTTDPLGRNPTCPGVTVVWIRQFVFYFLPQATDGARSNRGTFRYS